jgi:hypothetical protein
MSKEVNETIRQVVERVCDIYREAAQKYLLEGSQLMADILEYYSDYDRLNTELSNVFRGCSQEEIDSRLNKLTTLFEDKTFFVESMQKFFERRSSFKRTAQRKEENPIATEEEYEAGTYFESIERQVVEAVFALRRKGYNTFESGFKEKSVRNQYIGMYNLQVSVPQDLIEYFKTEGFEITLDRLGDRTIISIQPTGVEAVTLDEWKEIWNEFANRMPEAAEENLNRTKTYTMFTSFRKEQDRLRKAE